MGIKLLEEHLTPAEGEQVVRTYHCTTLDPMLLQIGSRINGHITVTNKRLVYFAQGYSGFGAKGNSREAIELPIADVCNIAQTAGTRFDIIRLIFGIITGVLVGALAASVMGFLNLKLMATFGGELIAPRLLILLDVTLAIFLLGRSLLVPCVRLTRVIYAAAGAGVLYSLLPIIIFLRVPTGYFWAGRGLGLVVAIYLLWCLYWFVRMNYVTIAISSKGGMTSPIRITGFSLWSRINVAAWDAANMAPAVDADRMFRELGALVTDIQTLGDHGIKKWSGREAEAKAEPAVAAKDYLERKPLVQRYAFGFIVLCAMAIATEGGITAHLRAVAEAKANASAVGLQVSAIKPRDGAKWAPNLMAKAERNETSAQSAFDREEYEEASVFWSQALTDFKVAGEAVQSLRAAYRDEMIYREHLRAVIKSALGKEVTGEHIEPAVLAELSSYMERNAGSEWTQMKDLARRAEALKKAEIGTECQAQWQAANKLFKSVREKIEVAKLQSTATKR